jgi:hypothetical protein
MKRRPFYECKIYIGSVSYKTNETFTQNEVEMFCGEVQEAYDYTIPVRITNQHTVCIIDEENIIMLENEKAFPNLSDFSNEV